MTVRHEGSVNHIIGNRVKEIFKGCYFKISFHRNFFFNTTTSIIFYFFESTLLYVTYFALGPGVPLLITRYPQLWNVRWSYPTSCVLQISSTYLTERPTNLFIMAQNTVTPYEKQKCLSAKRSGKSRHRWRITYDVNRRWNHAFANCIFRKFSYPKELVVIW